MTLEEFLKQAREPHRYNHRAWITRKGFHCLYVRFGQRAIKGQIVKSVLDIATVETEQPGKGTFKAFIKFLREEHPELNIFVENAHPQFGDGLVRMGFIRLQDGYAMTDIASNYFMSAKSDAVKSIQLRSSKHQNKNRAQKAKSISGRG